MLEKTLESKLDDYFDIVPKDLFEEAQEKAFQELESDQCTEDQCIMLIKEILQVENAFQLILMAEEGDTQISLTWNDLDRKRVEEEYCEGCKTKELRLMVDGLIVKLLGNRTIEITDKNVKENLELKKISNGTLYRESSSYVWIKGGKKWSKSGNKYLDGVYEGDIINGKPEGTGKLSWIGSSESYIGEWVNGDFHGQGIHISGLGEKAEGEFRDGQQWNGTVHKYGVLIGNYINGKWFPN